MAGHDLHVFYGTGGQFDVTDGWTREGAEAEGRWAVYHNGARLAEVVDPEGRTVATITREESDA